jgi:hypothetical protein
MATVVQQMEVRGEQIIRGANGCLVASHSQEGAWHVVKPVDGKLTCDCKGFEHRSSCRHIKAVADLEWQAKALAEAEQGPKRLPRRAYGEMDTAPVATQAVIVAKQDAIVSAAEQLAARRAAAIALVADLYE